MDSAQAGSAALHIPPDSSVPFKAGIAAFANYYTGHIIC